MAKHPSSYIFLFVFLGAGVWGMIFFSYLPVLQTIIAVSMGVGFVIWGVIHHHLQKMWHSKILWEYVATAFLGVIILLSLIWR